jgi:hypothetical protein
MVTEHNDTQSPQSPEPRKTLAQSVAAEVATQQQEAESAAIDEAAFAEPKFDKRSGTSNVGRRVAARIQQALRQ